MREETVRLPGFWRFVWLFWMQPVTLHRLLRSLEVNLSESGWELLRQRRSPAENWLLVRSAQMLLLLVLVLTAGLFAARDRHVEWFGLVLALVMASGLAFAVLTDVAVGLAVGLAFGVALVGMALFG